MRAALVAAVALAACGGMVEPPGVIAGPDARPVVVEHVPDGDSLVISIDGATHDARLIGVNAPERDECWGDEARQALREALAGAVVEITQDVEPTDRYDRLLVYVWTADGLVNSRLAGDGDVLARAFPPNTRHQDAIDAAGAAAEARGAGLWSGCASPEAAEFEVEVNANPPGPDEEALVDEWVAITTTAATDLSGWTLRDGSTANRYVFPAGTMLDAGQTLTVRTGCGTDTRTDLHWCATTPVWNNAGDDVLILDEGGRTVLATSYGG